MLENEKMRETLLYITIGSILFLMCSTLYFAYKKDHEWIKSRSLEDIIMETTETKILKCVRFIKSSITNESWFYIN